VRRTTLAAALTTLMILVMPFPALAIAQTKPPAKKPASIRPAAPPQAAQPHHDQIGRAHV